jgi:hypothetical protein
MSGYEYRPYCPPGPRMSTGIFIHNGPMTREKKRLTEKIIKNIRKKDADRRKRHEEQENRRRKAIEYTEQNQQNDYIIHIGWRMTITERQVTSNQSKQAPRINLDLN